VTTEVLTLSGTRGGEAFTLDVAVERPQHTLAGAATADNTTWNTYTQAQVAGVGALPVRRTFDGPNSGGVGANGIPTALSASRAASDVAAGRVSVHSFKPSPMTTGAAGGFDTQLTAFYDSVPDDHTYIGVIWHEPEDEVAAGTFTAATWRGANIRAAQRMKALSRPNLKFAICLRGFRTAFSYGGFAQFWEPAMDDLVDYILFDPYKDGGAGIPSTYAEYMASSMEFARSKGKRVGIAEWGINKTNTDSVRAAWVEQCWEWAKAQPDVDFSLYWHAKVSTAPAEDFTADPATSWPLMHAALRQMATEGQRI